MQSTYIWHKLNLHRNKVIIVLGIMLCAFGSHAQKKRWVQKNNPNYDEKKLTYGFLIGLHTSAFQIEYSDRFVTQDFDTVHSVVPDWSPGFSLGFIVNYRFTEFLDLRLTPEVSFYEHTLRYNYTDDTKMQEQLVETTMVELPLLLKYKSVRRGNVRMYMIGGVKPGFKASGNSGGDEARLEVKSMNMNLEAGFGFDLYYPLFKFSPEIRFSRGIVDVLDNRTNKFGQPLQRVNTNTITVYLLFQ